MCINHYTSSVYIKMYIYIYIYDFISGHVQYSGELKLLKYSVHLPWTADSAKICKFVFSLYLTSSLGPIFTVCLFFHFAFISYTILLLHFKFCLFIIIILYKVIDYIYLVGGYINILVIFLIFLQNINMYKTYQFSNYNL